MRRSILLSRRAKGYSWYLNYVNKGIESFRKFNEPTPFDWSKNTSRPKAFFSLKISDEKLEDIVFELAEDIVPKAVENFKLLCSGKGLKYPGYKDSIIHLVRKGEVIMGGDIEKKDGTGTHSAYAKRYFDDENFIIPHSSAGLLSMASTGVNSNASQFYISLAATPHLNGRTIVFGRVVAGEAALKTIAEVYTYRGAPSQPITIVDCGVIEPVSG